MGFPTSNFTISHTYHSVEKCLILHFIVYGWICFYQYLHYWQTFLSFLSLGQSSYWRDAVGIFETSYMPFNRRINSLAESVDFSLHNIGGTYSKLWRQIDAEDLPLNMFHITNYKFDYKSNSIDNVERNFRYGQVIIYLDRVWSLIASVRCSLPSSLLSLPVACLQSRKKGFREERHVCCSCQIR